MKFHENSQNRFKSVPEHLLIIFRKFKIFLKWKIWAWNKNTFLKRFFGHIFQTIWPRPPKFSEIGFGVRTGLMVLSWPSRAHFDKVINISLLKVSYLKIIKILQTIILYPIHGGFAQYHQRQKTKTHWSSSCSYDQWIYIYVYMKKMSFLSFLKKWFT